MTVASHQGMLTFMVTAVLLALPSLTNGEILHVRPTSTNTSCPTYPCHTLSEYAQDDGEYFKNSIITLQFLQGIHTLIVNLDITDIQQLKILGNPSTVIPTSIVCSSYVGFTFRNITVVRIEGLVFASCARNHQIRHPIYSVQTIYNYHSGVYLELVRMTEITNCTFQDSFGSALGVDASHVALTGYNSFFNGCRKCSNRGCSIARFCYGGGVFAHSSNVSFNGSTTFSKNSATTNAGGGVYAESSSVSFSGSTTFSKNSVRGGWAGAGGGVYAFSSNVSFNGSTTFSNNSATYYGGGVYAKSSSVSFNGSTTFSNSTATRGTGGGVYAYSGCSVSFNGSTTFSNNTAGYGGGGVDAGSSSVSFNGSTTFSNNLATAWGGRGGGGVMAHSSSSVSFNGSTTFSNNSATGDGGGGVHAVSSSVSFNGSTTFSNNSATHDGGGVYAYPGCSVSFNGSTTFSNNTATQDGGGVYAVSSSVNFSGSTTFSNNSATHDGGGVYAYPGCSVSFNGSTTFNNNSATQDGGGVYAESSSVSFNGSTTFSNNSATQNGGGVYAYPDCSVSFNGSTTFSNNSATQDGGGVYAESSSVSFNGSTTFSNNSATQDGGGVDVIYSFSVSFNGITTFTNNSVSGKGGGLHADSSIVCFKGSTTFSNNSGREGGGICADSTRVSFNQSATFINNSASKDGGGIYASGVEVSFSGTNVISTNTAAGYGGGVYAPHAFLNLHGDNIFNANLAGYSGGGIYAPQSQMDFGGTSMLSKNTAQLDGGGIYADGSNVSLSGNITIRYNTAGLGGAIYSDNSTLNVYGCNVEGNIATYGGGLYTRRALLVLAGNNMFNVNTAGEGGGIFATTNSTLIFDGLNSFNRNHALVSGGGIWLDNSKLSLNGSNSFVECTAAYEGGGIFTYASNATLPGSNTFVSNSATTGGGIHARWSYVDIKRNSNTAFRLNTAVFGAGIFTDNSTFEFTGASTFISNHATYTGGGMYAARSNLSFLATSSVMVIANYAAKDGGGIYTRDGCVVNLLGFNSYEFNLAEDTGGGISAYQSSFSLSGHNTFTVNKAVTGGGFYASNSTVIFPGENAFTANSAIRTGGGVAATHSTLHINGLITVENNSALSGGGFSIEHSTVQMDGKNYFMNNTANFEGGAIYFSDCRVELSGKSRFVTNTAGNKGAAIQLSFTTLILQGTSSFVNNSANYGGGIQSSSSNLTFVNLESSHHVHISLCCINCKNSCDISGSSFLNNTADRGGALYLDQYSNFSLYLTTSIYFEGNRATNFGGALYVADASGPGQFLPLQHTPSRSECFFHILGKEQPPYLESAPLVFKNNFAGIRGSALYGGLLGKCTLTSVKYSSALDLFRRSVVHSSNGSFISSDPTQLCFCSREDQNCTDTIQSKTIYPGQHIEVSVIAVDQSDTPIPTLVHVSVRSGNDNVTEIITYETERNCTSRMYSAPPNNAFNQLELYPNNRSGSTVHLTVNIIFENCPIGFEQSNFSGECICDHRLWQFTNTCNIQTQSILRTGGAIRNFWLGVTHINGTPMGIIHHRYCPLDYCIKEDKYININDPDDQCSNNRSGLLCGQCRKELSLLLGSSQCKKCSNAYLALLILFALAGVLLVTLLFLLHLTVVEGTLHGLIFYANIVEANHHIFFPQSSISINPASTFVAWLNFDLGIQTCFYDGMDSYARAWLEFLFPVYIWGIVGFLVYINDRFTRVTKFLGSSPVPVLATVFLLSYAKVLCTIIAMLSLTTLYYPYNTQIVWVHDANIPLTKYIPLALVAVLFLIFLFLPYTLLLLVGQWLQPKSHLRFLSWIRSPKVKAILGSYHAPYKLKHRYWTGLLLLLRCALFLIFAFNVTGNDSINLLIISSTALGTTVAFVLTGMIYKRWYLNALELSFILNLGILAAATYHVSLSGGSQAAVAYTSVGIAFLTFVGIVVYHIFVRIKSRVQYTQRGRILLRVNNQHHEDSTNDSSGCQAGVTPAVTYLYCA